LSQTISKETRNFLYTTSGHAVGELIHILLKLNIPEERVCTVQPLGVTENASFVVDIDSVHFEDLEADDLGVWSPTGTKRTFFRFTQSGTLKISQKTTSSGGHSDYYTLTRRYYIHKTYPKFHRQLVDIKGE